MTRSDAPTRDAVKPWRRDLRRTLTARRMDMARDDRKARDRAIEQVLYDTLASAQAHVIALYWPFRGEFNCRALMRRLVAEGRGVVLPVVAQRNRPLIFREWTPDTAMERGVFDIPAPRASREIEPDAIVSPVVGFDAACYRLGNGGGYYDRTLAAFRRPVFTVGVGYELARLDTIHPQAHDVALDRIVTEAGLHAPADGKQVSVHGAADYGAPNDLEPDA